MVSELRRLKVAVTASADVLDPTAPQQLSALLRAITRCVASLQERKHEVLITELLDLPLWSAPSSSRAAALDFIVHAVVANGALVQSCLHTLVYSLLPPPGPAAPDPSPGEKWNPLPLHAAVQDDVISALTKVLELVPTSAQRLSPLLQSNFPHKLRDRTTHCLYLRGMFTLAESKAGAGVREHILFAVVDHLINIDVEIKWEDIVDVWTEEAKEEEGGAPPGEEEPDIFELEGMSELELVTGHGHNADAEGDNGAMPGGGWEGGVARRGPANGRGGGGSGVSGNNNNNIGNGEGAPVVPIAVDETADKLDSMMEMTLEHLSHRIELGQLPAAWSTAMSAFERTILQTHRSKFVQFLLFYMARNAPEQCCGSLVGFLLTRISDRLQAPITRSAAAAYAGSFLARAGFIPEPLVVEALQRLADWCVRYTKEEDRRGGLPPIPSSSALTTMAMVEGRDRHAPFYAACQSLLYSLCYHMEPLLKQKARSAGATGAAANGGGASPLAHHASEVLQACAHGIEQLFADVMPRLLSHSLDPLSSCARSVVLEFGRQAGALGHPELLKIVREWERRRTAASARSIRPLEVFFPFDPYLLRRSASFLELDKSYVRWRKGHPSGAPRAGLAGGSDDEMWEEELALLGEEDSSGLESSSSDDLSSDESSSGTDSDSSSDDDASSSDSDADGLRKSRFGSMPDSSLSSGGRGGRRKSMRRRLPGALKASLVHGQGGSPTTGVPIPGHGSLSTDGGGSPWGVSPTGAYFGSFAPMSMTPGA